MCYGSLPGKAAWRLDNVLFQDCRCFPLIISPWDTLREHTMDTSKLTVYFRERTFSAVAELIHENRPHVHVLDLPLPSNGLLWLRWLVALLPSHLQNWLHHTLQAWFIPQTTLLKQRNPTRPEEHVNELAIYQRLRGIQGEYVPRLFGEAAVYAAKSKRVPALLLEFVPGRSLFALPLENRVSGHALRMIKQGHRPQPDDYERMPNPQLQDALTRTYVKITEAGVLHGDPKTDNFIRRRDGTIVAVDFEFARPLTDGENHDKEPRTILYGFADEVDDAAISYHVRAARLAFKRKWWNRRVEDEGAY